MPGNGERATEGSIHLRVSSDGEGAAGGRASVVVAQVEALLATLEAATEPSERAEILVEVAHRLHGDLGDARQAIDALLEAWKTDPMLESILDALEPLARSEHCWPEVLEATRALASRERVTARGIAYAEAMVRWLTGEVPDPELARQWLERIRALDSTHWQVHMLQAAMSREHGDLKRELDELDLAVLSARRTDDRARIPLMMAARYMAEKERSFSLADAKKHFGAAHKLLPRSMDPLRGLEQIAIHENDKVSLADVLRRQADADLDDAERIAILLWLAKIEEEDFRKPEQAAKTLERVIAIAPGHAVAIEGLERTYGAARAWPELVVVLERAVASSAEPQLRVARLERLAAVFETKLEDVRAAVATYERLQLTMPEDETVLTELARLKEKLGDVRAAVHYREKLAELASVPSVRARMHVMAGQLLVPVDSASARQQFERAVAADPSSQAAWSALLWDARAENDTARAERYLEERAWKTETPRARASAFVELAEARAKRGDRNGARIAYEEAASSDPSNESAAVALVTALVEEGRHADAEPLCEVAISAAERDKDYDRILTLRLAQARAATALGKPERALAATLAAYQVRPDTREAKEALVRAAAPMRADPQILSAREALVVIADKPEGLSVEARADLGDILVLVGEAERAAVLYDGVLKEAPEHDRALAGLAQHHAAAGNPIAALSLKRQLAQTILDPDARFAELVAIADQFSAKGGGGELAADVYEEARKLCPRDLPTLHKLLALYPKLGRWASLFDVLRSIAESDVDPARKAKTLFTMAQIAMEELGDRGAALALFDQALDVDPSQLVAFESIVRILTEDRDWLGLDEMYKRMLVRALAGGDRDVGLQHALYKQIGLVYRDRLGEPQKAIEAFQAAVHLKPDDDQAQTILRELLSHTGQSHGAVAVTIERVLREPLDPAPYPALFELLSGQGARDRALCVATAMAFLGVAHAGAQGFRLSYPQPPIDAIVLDLGAEGYRDLLHDELDPALTEIFEVIAPAVVDVAISRLTLRDRLAHPGPALKGHEWLGRAVGRAGAIFGMPPPRVFQRSRGAGPALVAAATKPASLLVHPPALGGIAPGVVSFLIGKRVFEISPPLLARALCPSITELKGLAQSAARIATDQAEAGDVPLKQRLGRKDVARLSSAVHDAMSRTGKLDVLRWSQWADVSASRAGLLLAGDLEAARGGIAFEAQLPSDLSPREKMKELVGWFLGDSSAALRKRLGVAL
jgi:tetratricopeptide (TPR) repeat protein